MLVLVIFTFALVALLALLIVGRYLSLWRAPFFITFPLFLAVFIPCSIVVLVPIDLTSSTSDNHPLFYLSEKSRLVVWRIFYWLSFVLTWTILPLLQSYVDSGHINPLKKFRYSLKANARYHIIVLSLGTIGLIYYIGSAGFSLSAIKALVIALSYSYSLVLAIWLMGHGLAMIPRRLLLRSSPSAELRILQREAPNLHDSYLESISILEEVHAEVNALRSQKNGPYQEWIESLLESIGNSTGNSISPETNVVNESYLSSLSRRLRIAEYRYSRYSDKWRQSAKRAARCEDIMNSRSSKTLVFRLEKSHLPANFAYIFHNYIKRWTQYLLILVLFASSLIIIWSELTHSSRISLVGIIIDSTSGTGQQIISSIILAYMCAATFDSLSRVKVFDIYALVRRHTDPVSALWYSMYLCRLSVPLSYNYLTLTPRNDSVFQSFLGASINLTPLGLYFSDWLPRIIVLPFLFAYFGVYEKAKDLLGYGLAFDDEQDRLGSWTDGSELLRREIQVLERSSSGTTSNSSQGPNRGGLDGNTATNTRNYEEGPAMLPFFGNSNRTPHERGLNNTSGDGENNVGELLESVKDNLGDVVKSGFGRINEGFRNFAQWIPRGNSSSSTTGLTI